MFTIKIVGPGNGEHTEFDGQYVSAYDPEYVHPDGYDGGILEVTEDINNALHFGTVTEALDKWRQEYGLRADGRPNRPLTAFTVEIEYREGGYGPTIGKR